MQYCKKHVNEFDVFFSTFNEMDFGKRGIQYIHFPIINESVAREMQSMSNLLPYRDTFLRCSYKGLCERISNFSLDSIRENFTLTNSNWTGRVIQKAYGVTPKVVYPPIVGDFPLRPWKQRENGFVCVGRISPEKKIENIIKILQKVRERGFNTNLHIICKGQNSAYGEQILSLIEENSSWITLNEDLSREKVLNVLTTHKYGIHGMPREHLGLTVAEMVKAGNIVFVPNDGGQVEIVGNNPNLVYENDEDAVEKIIKVIFHSDLQHSLLEFLSTYANKFTLERFKSEIKEVVLSALEQKE
jgi:glycosyltransferase involved in cell wall biosynthesis